MALRKLPRTEFAAAVAQIAGERKIDPKAVIESVKLAIIAAYKKDAKEAGQEIDPEAEYQVKLDSETGGAKIFFIEGKKEKDVTPPGFGRVAAQTAKQIIIQKIREAEKEALFGQFESRIGSLVTGTVLRMEKERVMVGIGKAEAVMPRREQIFGENYQLSARMTFLIKDIGEEEGRKEIIVSRADPNLIVELFRREVPEVSLGSVRIEKISRQPGKRTKVAVASSQPGVDPVGSCVGQKGVRVQEVIREIGDEKIDIIPYSDDQGQFIISALSPAEGGKIMELDKEKKTVTVTIPLDQLALAIGSGGENVRSASELTGYEIKVAASEEKEEEGKSKSEKTTVKKTATKKAAVKKTDKKGKKKKVKEKESGKKKEEKKKEKELSDKGKKKKKKK